MKEIMGLSTSNILSAATNMARSCQATQARPHGYPEHLDIGSGHGELIQLLRAKNLPESVTSKSNRCFSA
jgi:hypothetical protein